MMLAAVLGLLALAPQAEPPARRIDVRLSIEEKDGLWRFVVSATTDLPEGARLGGALYVLDSLDNFKGGRVDDEVLLLDRRRKFLPKFTVAGGAVGGLLFESRRKPFSLRYRARIRYDRGNQGEEIASAAGADSVEGVAELAVGGPGDLEKDLKAAGASIAADLEKTLGLFRELEAEFAARKKTVDEKRFDAVAWRDWSRGWSGRVALLRRANEDRWDLNLVWIEMQGRARLDSLLEGAEAILDHNCDPALRGVAGAFEGARQSFTVFMKEFTNTQDLLGVDAPFDLAMMTPLVNRLDAILVEAGRMIDGKDAAAWAARGADLRRESRDAFLALGDRRVVPRRGYEALSALVSGFNELWASFDGLAGDPEPLRSLLAAQQKALKAFRALAEGKGP